MDQNEIQENLERVEERICRALAKCGRKRADIRLIVVSKAQPAGKILAAYQCGIRTFGENYPEETAEKMPLLEGYKDIEWHMIGHLQSRKAKIVAGSFHFMHSLDSIRTAEKLEPLLAERDRTLPVLIEINTGGEVTKNGLKFESGSSATAIEDFVEKLGHFSHLKISGLMTMPPLWEEPEKTRPYFQNLRLLKENLEKSFPTIEWKEMSMGTSGDFETAIEEGSTMIRVGQAVLGERIYNKQT